MKKIVIVLILVVFGFQSKAQTGVPDTLAHLQSIVANKSHFIGQPFSKLLDSLKVRIKFFSPFSSIHYDVTKETSTEFSFYFPYNADEIYLTYPSLEIYWQSPLNATQSRSLYVQNRAVGWSSSIAAFYTSGIIRDIRLIE